jgi:septum formation protein
MKLILASQSPRRRELLAQLGYQFDCIAADINEDVHKDEQPGDYVDRLAREKAKHIAQPLSESSTLVLGSDTTVVINGKILGKPESINQCIEMLTLLSNNNHQVYTSVAVAQGENIKSVIVCTDVYFKKLSPQEITRYWQTGEPQDKAGAYGIQGIGGQFVTKIEGSYSSVVGLPLYETAQLLAQFGLPTSIQAGEDK